MFPDKFMWAGIHKQLFMAVSWLKVQALSARAAPARRRHGCAQEAGSGGGEGRCKGQGRAGVASRSERARLHWQCWACVEATATAKAPAKRQTSKA